MACSILAGAVREIAEETANLGPKCRERGVNRGLIYGIMALRVPSLTALLAATSVLPLRITLERGRLTAEELPREPREARTALPKSA